MYVYMYMCVLHAQLNTYTFVFTFKETVSLYKAKIERAGIIALWLWLRTATILKGAQ